MAENPTVDNAGRLVIPKRLRERYGLTAGTAVEFVAEAHGVMIVAAAKHHRRVRRGRIIAIDTGAGTADETDFDVQALRDEHLTRTTEQTW